MSLRSQETLVVQRSVFDSQSQGQRSFVFNLKGSVFVKVNVSVVRDIVSSDKVNVLNLKHSVATVKVHVLNRKDVFQVSVSTF